MGFANPVLYNLASAQQQFAPFHDVTSGTNLFYPATANYDMGSGIGSPDIFNIAQDIAGGAAPPPSPTASPTPSPTDTPTPGPTATSTPAPPPTPVPTDTPAPPPPPSSGSLIQNGDFEQGVDPWQETSANGYELVDTTNPHSGQYSAYLCGYSNCNDSIAQDFTVPGNASGITVSYWWFGNTTRTSHSCRDSFTVTMLDSNGSIIGRLQRSCNTNATNRWQQVSFDVTSKLSNFGGQTVTLLFNARTSGSFSVTSSFFVDDVEVSG
jgi:kumamolisin